MKIITILVVSILLLAFECAREENNPMLSQEVLFAKLYENQAWSDQYEGWFIDNSGYVRGFSIDRSPELEWFDLSGGGFISENRVLSNYHLTDTTFLNLPLSEVVKHYQLINDASKGILSEAIPNGADMGQLSFYALLFDQENHQYRFILLESYGDHIVNNTSGESQKIAGWMKDVDNQISLRSQ